MSETSAWIKQEDVPAYLEKGWRVKTQTRPSNAEAVPGFADALKEFWRLVEAEEFEAAQAAWDSATALARDYRLAHGARS